MSEYTRSHKSRWSSPKYRALSRSAKLLFEWLQSHEVTNWSGIFQLRRTLLAEDLGIYGDEVKKLLHEIETVHERLDRDAKPLIVRDLPFGLVWVVGLWEHRGDCKSSVCAAVLGEFVHGDDSFLWVDFLALYPDVLDKARAAKRGPTSRALEKLSRLRTKFGVGISYEPLSAVAPENAASGGADLFSQPVDSTSIPCQQTKSAPCDACDGDTPPHLTPPHLTGAAQNDQAEPLRGPNFDHAATYDVPDPLAEPRIIVDPLMPPDEVGVVGVVNGKPVGAVLKNVAPDTPPPDPPKPETRDELGARLLKLIDADDLKMSELLRHRERLGSTLFQDLVGELADKIKRKEEFA